MVSRLCSGFVTIGKKSVRIPGGKIAQVLKHTDDLDKAFLRSHESGFTGPFLTAEMNLPQDHLKVVEKSCINHYKSHGFHLHPEDTNCFVMNPEDGVKFQKMFEDIFKDQM